MRVGPAHHGDLLEVGVLGIDTDDPVIVHSMRARPNTYPTDDQSESHAHRRGIQRAAKLADEFDPSAVPMDDTTDLRTLAEAVDSVRTGEARVRELVARARANGRSWGEIGIALGVSRQAARERFAEKIRA
jgi:hypothetical protein